MDQIPPYLRKQFTQPITAVFAEFNALAALADADPAALKDPKVIARGQDMRRTMQKLAQEFTEAGGTMGMWNILASEIHYGLRDDEPSPGLAP